MLLKTAKLLVLVWVMLICISCTPIYHQLAESHSSLRGPWGWDSLPPETPYSETGSQKNSELLHKARDTLQNHQASIGAPAISIAIAQQGEILWAASSGWADIASGVPVTPDHMFRIGSTSKAVTATVLAQFVDRDYLHIDQTVGETLSPLPNPDWAPIRIRHLASHMSGIPHYGNNKDLGGLYASMKLSKHYPNVDDTLSAFEGSRLLAVPGTSFNYSSYGTNLLAAILQDVGHQKFQLLLKNYINDPLELPTPIPDQEHEKRVEFYQQGKHKVKTWRNVDLSLKLAGGGLMARPQDLVILGNAWLNDSFISPETRNAFWKKQRLLNGEPNHQDYAIGWRWDSEREIAHHGGVSKGAMTWLAIHPGSGLSVAICINTVIDEFWDFAQIQDEFFELFKSNTNL